MSGNSQTARALTRAASADGFNPSNTGAFSPDVEDFEALETQARAALEDLAANGSRNEALTVEYMCILRTYRQACERRAQYVEADLVQRVLRYMRLDEETRHVCGLTELQRQERDAIETLHREEVQEFHHAWNMRIDELEEEQLRLETALIERQNAELQSFYEEVNSLNPHAAKCSRGLLYARAVEHILASQREYVRAHKKKKEADTIEARDAERFVQAKVELLERREAMMRQKHEQERHVLEVKAKRRRAEMEAARKRELYILLRRYLNAQRELELHQNIVRSKTGTILLKHASNTKGNTSGTAVLVESAESGAFGIRARKQHLDNLVDSCTLPKIGTKQK
ncbi:hypothetical protein, conserved [Trypanosoma brucei gambiense DAL972]|uniref:Uncharacterized protein n=2 Tax=Trypanosoma brucei TaxID=5691 RepID=D0A491_TRYB9|nr:hypothetical protein, conserved [Trypanosoma brucei gambiense DAL972]CBH16085.1 hypothetical protein, conserved [Trypanosoma brucei gambiense DAL972]|eukprot:XP_011778349.1 hypothetical protein, conserved [Trypanosoma brucei gambiense DAL972]